MDRTSLGPQKIFRVMGSSSHWGLITVPGQEANSDNLDNYFVFFYFIFYSMYAQRILRVVRAFAQAD